MDAVHLGRLAAGDEDAEVDEGRARLRHGGDAQLVEEVDAVRGGCDADEDKVSLSEVGELVVVELGLGAQK